MLYQYRPQLVKGAVLRDVIGKNLLSLSKTTKGISGLNELPLRQTLVLLHCFLCQRRLNLLTDSNRDSQMFSLG